MKGFFEPQEEDVNFLEEKYKVSRPSVFGLKENEVKKEEYLPKKTPCQCKLDNSQDAIFCEKHQCVKSKHLQELCAFDQRYFDLWENGEGPMQDPISQMQYLEKPEDPFFANKTIVKQNSDDYTSEFFMGDPEIPAESRGLGDTIAKITKATGIKKVTKTVFGAIKKDCGCKERQNKLNKLFPYKKGQEPKGKTKGFFE